MENECRAAGPLDFGALLRSYRLVAGLSQEGLAERAGMSAQGIRALERGYRRTPQRETLALLAGALTLDYEQRREFETAAARWVLLRSEGRASVAGGLWPDRATPNLPLALTRFVGREGELDEITAMVRDHRLVTLTGAGGIGKTQMGLQVAATMRDAGDMTVCFVGLAPLRDPSLIPRAIASALDVQEVPNRPLPETLLAYLRNRTLLLILDNCEHVIRETATVAQVLLTGCSRVRILATSREPLRAAGEHSYLLPSLNERDARALFFDRAQSVDRRFALTEENASIVADLCRRLDGIPLAIELAAARVNVLSLEVLVGKLNDRFAILTVGERTALPRQQTMRATVDWSYELLAPHERHVFERLSVFSGGCTIEAATRVCANGDVASDVLSVISSLVDKSLVIADLEGAEPRYRLLESFREFAREKLKARGEENAVASRHALAYLEQAEWYNRSWDKLHYTATARYLHDEINNWRAAVQWALSERGDVLLGQRLVGWISLAWAGHIVIEVRRWIVMASELVDERTPLSVVAKLKCEEASVARHLEHHQAQLASAEQAIALCREVGNEFVLMRAQQIAGNALYDLGRDGEARIVLHEALSAARRFGSRSVTAQLLRELACASMDDHEFEAAHRYLGEAFPLLEAADDQIHLTWATVDLANLAFEEGDAGLAIRHLKEALAMGDALAAELEAPSRIPPRIAAVALDHLSRYLIFLERYDEAEKRARDGLDTALDQQLDVYGAQALENLAIICALRQQAKATTHESCIRAARVLGFADAQLSEMGFARDRESMLNRERALMALHERIGDNVVADLMALGAAMTQDEAVEEALAP